MQLLNYGHEFAHGCGFHGFHAQGKVVIINNRIHKMEGAWEVPEKSDDGMQLAELDLI